MAVLLKGQVNLKERTRMGFRSKQLNKSINKPLTKREIAVEKEKIMGNVLGASYKRQSVSGKKRYLKTLDEVIRRKPKSFNSKMNEFEKYYYAQRIVKQLEEQRKYSSRMYLKSKRQSGGGGGTITRNRNRKTTKSKKKSKTKTSYTYKSKWTKYRKWLLMIKKKKNKKKRKSYIIKI